MSGDKREEPRPLWLTWETQRRNRELASALDAELAELDFGGRGPLRRYVKSLAATIPLFWRFRRRGERRPTVVVQCPSLVLVASSALFSVVLGFHLIIDAHNVSRSYLESENRWVRLLARYGFSRAGHVVVTNELMATRFSPYASQLLILPDRLPSITARNTDQGICERYKRPIVTLISSFAEDEPIEEFIEASLEVPQSHTLVVTGRKERAGRLLRFEQAGVRFSGFLPLSDYEELIAGSDVLVDLTTRDDCLVCGAYEALSVGTPLILSDSEALRSTFGSGPIYAKNEKEDYVQGIIFGLERSSELRSAMASARDRFETQWEEQFRRVCARIYEKCG